MTDLPTPTGPPAEAKKDRSKLYKWAGVGVAVLVVFAVLSDGDSKDEAAPPATTVQAPVTTVRAAPTTTISDRDLDEMIQMIAMESVLDQNGREICRLVRELVRDGLSLTMVVDLAVDSFNEGLDEQMFPKVEREFRNRMRECM
jgi:hypothetical protein